MFASHVCQDEFTHQNDKGGNLKFEIPKGNLVLSSKVSRYNYCHRASISIWRAWHGASALTDDESVSHMIDYEVMVHRTVLYPHNLIILIKVD